MLRQTLPLNVCTLQRLNLDKSFDEVINSLKKKSTMPYCERRSVLLLESIRKRIDFKLCINDGCCSRLLMKKTLITDCHGTGRVETVDPGGRTRKRCRFGSGEDAGRFGQGRKRQFVAHRLSSRRCDSTGSQTTAVIAPPQERNVTRFLYVAETPRSVGADAYCDGFASATSLQFL